VVSRQGACENGKPFILKKTPFERLQAQKRELEVETESSAREKREQVLVGKRLTETEAARASGKEVPRVLRTYSKAGKQYDKNVGRGPEIRNERSTCSPGGSGG